MWLFFFFNDTATTEIYTLPLHDALPIFASVKRNGKREQVLKAIVNDQLRRAWLAFPDEDVLVGGRVLDPAGDTAHKRLQEAGGEEHGLEIGRAHVRTPVPYRPRRTPSA